jgi:GNAT superfamily N-acetyltransferase
MSEEFPVIRTVRFIIHRHEIMRDDALGGMPRTVFQAWHHSEDIPRPVCVVTINECFMNHCEWLYVDEHHRRKGIATEVMRAIEADIGECDLTAVTDEGEAFCNRYLSTETPEQPPDSQE